MCNNYIYVVFVGGKQITWFLEIVCVFSPHLCVGFLFLVLYPVRLLLRSWSVCTLSYTQLCNTPSFTHTHNFVTHLFVTHHLSHTTLSQTNFVTHTHHLSHTHNTPSFTRNFFTHQLYHAHTQLCHTPSFTYNFVLHNFVTHTSRHNFVTHQLCHTLSFTHQLCHTPSVSHTIFHIQLCHTPLCHTPTLSQTIFHFACQAWHLLTSTFVLRGRHGTYGRIELAFSDGQWSCDPLWDEAFAAMTVSASHV